MPGSNGPVSLAPLPDPGDHGFRAFVRFPHGWSRPGMGHYPVPEEFIVLEGALALNGHTWRAGGYAWIPAHHARSDTRTPAGCLAFAWFGGLPRWVPGRAAEASDGPEERFAHWMDAPRRQLRDGARIRELRTGPEHATWIVEANADPARVLPLAGHECLDLHDFSWSAGPPARGAASRGALLVRAGARPA